jgi:hypothetical protein
MGGYRDGGIMDEGGSERARTCGLNEGLTSSTDDDEAEGGW